MTLYRKRLYAGTKSSNKKYDAGKVPSNKEHATGTVQEYTAGALKKFQHFLQ